MPASVSASEYVSGMLPMLLRMIVWVAEGPLLIRRSANIAIGGVSTASARPATHVRFVELVPPASVSLVNVTVALCMSDAFAGGAHTMPTVAGAVSAENVQACVPAVHPCPAAKVNHVLVDGEIVALMIESTPTFVAAVFVMLMFAVSELP